MINNFNNFNLDLIKLKNEMNIIDFSKTFIKEELNDNNYLNTSSDVLDCLGNKLNINKKTIYLTIPEYRKFDFNSNFLQVFIDGKLLSIKKYFIDLKINSLEIFIDNSDLIINNFIEVVIYKTNKLDKYNNIIFTPSDYNGLFSLDIYNIDINLKKEFNFIINNINDLVLFVNKNNEYIRLEINKDYELKYKNHSNEEYWFSNEYSWWCFIKIST